MRAWTIALGCGLALLMVACGGSGAVTLEANAGADQNAVANELVLLDASGTIGGDGQTPTYAWMQVSGPTTVMLTNPNSMQASFLAPSTGGVYVFQVTATLPGGINSVSTTTVTVAATTPAVTSTQLSSTPVNGGGEGRAEISAFHPATARLFVTNAEDGRIDVLNLANPALPVAEGFLDLAANSQGVPVGGPNSVAVSGNVVAVAVEAANKQDPGVVQFYDATTLMLITQGNAGALPDMLAFTPNGTLCVVANEGEPNDDYTVDPVGSVSVFNAAALQPGVPPVAGVAGFGAFDGQLAALQAQRIRIFGPGATVSQDLEPEYISFSSDGAYAYVSCQENNALAIVELVPNPQTADVQLFPFGLKDWSSPDLEHSAQMILHRFRDLPTLGTTLGGQEIKLGGFSGLYYLGTAFGTGNLRFATIPDRGPQLGRVNVDGDPVTERPFALPDYQARVVIFELDTTTGVITIDSQTTLRRADGQTPITGRPNLLATMDGLAHHDEEAVNVFGQPLGLDAFGGDFEGILQAPDGTWWMCDEYRPAIYHFEANGILIDRFVPTGANGFGTVVGTEALPEVYAQRRANRGFEALAFDETAGRLYAWIQSPIDNPDVADDANSKASSLVRILEFDPATSTTTGEYVYVIDKAAGSDKIGDAVWTGNPGEFFVLERNSSTGGAASKSVYRVDLAGATDLQTLGGAYAAIAGPGGTLEGTAPDQLANLMPAITPVGKKLYINLANAGYTAYDKPEGLALLPDGRLAVLNDNDFGIAGATLNTQTGQIILPPNTNTDIALALCSATTPGLDASNQDMGINIQQWPVLGMYQPDAIATFTVEGTDYIVTANEGDGRDYGGTPGYVGEERIRNLVLDFGVFPDRFDLQLDENLGRLKVTIANGDVEPDGEFEELWTYGARSFSVWATDGNTNLRQVYDSSDLIARVTSQMEPALFNSQGTAASFDSRSDDKGAEPEGLVVGEIAGRPHLFLGLERFGAVMVFDLSNPFAPRYVTMFRGANDVSPEGLTFIPAAQSPNGQPLLAVTYEVSGTVGIFQLGAL